MPIRITGMNSGLDTESIITELVKAKATKKDDLVKAQTKLQWKQDAWKELNSKVYSLYSKSLSNMRFTTDYYKKTTKVSNANAATVITGTDAVVGVQTLKINSLAKSGYLTGAELKTKDGKDVSGSTTLKDLGLSGDNLSFRINGRTKTFKESATLNDVVNKLKEEGVNASFDDKNNRFFISSKSTGKSSDFTLEGDILKTLGISALSTKEREQYKALCDVGADGKYIAKTFTGDAEQQEKAEAAAIALNAASEGATRIYGSNAEIELNGATFVSNTNTFQINGLTITANEETDHEITLSTENDTDGIYDMIKNFLKEYNELINEMDKLYNADSAKGYEPLTDEEKEAMSEKEIEKWEEKIKDSILRRDTTLSSVASAMKTVMLQGVEMSNGKQMHLSDFGINTLGYFNAADNEKNAYHIDGDPDDTNTSGNGDKLKTAIANNPDQVVEFFTTLSRTLYQKLGDMMKKTAYSSSFTLYDDIAMKEEYKEYTSKITSQEEKIADFEDRYYKKFSAMETALAKITSKETAISGLFNM